MQTDVRHDKGTERGESGIFCPLYNANVSVPILTITFGGASYISEMDLDQVPSSQWQKKNLCSFNVANQRSWSRSILLPRYKPNLRCKIYNALWEVLPLFGHLTFNLSRLFLSIIINYCNIFPNSKLQYVAVYHGNS